MKHFQLYELVSKVTLEALGDDSWNLFNPEALKALDDLRDFFGVPFTINNWKSGGSFQHRGYRTLEEATALGSPNSQHRFGNAFDCNIEGIAASEARKKICDNKDDPLLIRIQRLEDGVSWVHFDLKPVTNRIYLFRA